MKFTKNEKEKINNNSSDVFENNFKTCETKINDKMKKLYPKIRFFLLEKFPILTEFLYLFSKTNESKKHKISFEKVNDLLQIFISILCEKTAELKNEKTTTKNMQKMS